MKAIQLTVVVFLLIGAVPSPPNEAEKVLCGHESTVLSLAIDARGKYLVSGSYDTDMILWDFPSGKMVKKYPQLNAGVWNVRISPDSKYVAFGSWDNNKNARGSTHNCLGIVDLQTLGLVKLLSVTPDRYKTARFIPELDDSTTNGIRSISFRPDGSQMAAITNRGDLFIWDLKDHFKLTKRWYGDTQHRLLDMSPDWNYLVCCERKRTMVDSCFYFLSMANDEIVARFDVPQKTVIRTFFSHNRQLIASIGGDRIKRNEIDVWDTATQQLKRTLIGHSNVIRSIDFSKDDRFLVSTGEDNLVNLWNVATGELLATFTGNNAKELTSVLFSPNDDYLVTGSQDKTIKYWRVADLVKN